MILIVDQNEKATNPKIISSLEKHFSKVIISNLKCGDVNIPMDDGSVLAIERKAPYDFLASIADGRIFEQVESMALHAKYSAFIVTGTFTYKDKSDIVCIDGESTNWKGSAVRTTMTVIQFSGCPIIFCPENKYSETIAELYNTVNKPDERRGIRKNRIITFPPVDDRVQLMAQFPGVGLKLAESIMHWVKVMENDTSEDEYPSIALTFHWLSIMAQIDKGSRPEGWGAKKILTFRKFMGLASNEYIAINSEKQEMVNDNEEKEPF